MPTLRKSPPKDVQGNPIDPGRLYEPLVPHGRVVNGAPRVYNPGTELRGSHEAVVAAPSLWLAADLPSDQKEAARRTHRAASLASLPPAPLSPEQRIVEPRKIPQARRMIATESFWSGPDFVKLGQAYDIDDPVRVRVPQYFKPALEPDEAA